MTPNPLFKYTCSTWVHYDQYEWVKTKDDQLYLTPSESARPEIYDPIER